VQLAWVSLIGAFFCSGFGNALSKRASHLRGRPRIWGLLAAIGCFGFGLILYALALTGIPLGIAYPILIGGSVVLVTMLAITWLRERVSMRQGIGIVLILVGLVLLNGGHPIEAVTNAEGVDVSAGTDR
jgi:multidrug transporter EmrE-like cation transporter